MDDEFAQTWSSGGLITKMHILIHKMIMIMKKTEKKFEKADDVVADKSTEVEEFVKSFYDYTNNQFPKGETAVNTAVEKKFGDAQIKTAQEAIAKLMSDKDPKMSRIKKLAGIP